MYLQANTNMGLGFRDMRRYMKYLEFRIICVENSEYVKF